MMMGRGVLIAMMTFEYYTGEEWCMREVEYYEGEVRELRIQKLE
jgi:hypothetical protein